MSEDTKIPTIDVKKYGGKQVALIGGEIVAAGRTWEEVLKKARKACPGTPLSEISVFAVPKSIYTIYHA
jgi:carbamoylphosphate synthase large subunit